jgi:NH3-dependent NAD+ synthetase
MVLTTGNKSEMSVGYATLYGDMCGGYSVLKDVYKTTVFELSRWRNRSTRAGARARGGSSRSASSPSRRRPSCAEPEGPGQPAALRRLDDILNAWSRRR